MNSLSPSSETEPCAIEGQLVCLKISSEVPAKLDIPEAINTGGKGSRDADSSSNDAKGLCHCRFDEFKAWSDCKAVSMVWELWRAPSNRE